MDVTNAMIQLMDSDITAERFIVSGQNSSYKAIFSQVALGFGKHPPHKKVTPLLAEIVWRLEAVKALLSGKSPLLTKETARTAQTKVYYNNDKLLKYLPNLVRLLNIGVPNIERLHCIRV